MFLIVESVFLCLISALLLRLLISPTILSSPLGVVGQGAFSKVGGGHIPDVTHSPCSVALTAPTGRWGLCVPSPGLWEGL